MTVRLRSNVVERQEKGLGPFTLKRLLLAGGTAAGVTLVLGRLAGFAASCASGALVMAVVLALTQPVEGMPLLRFAAATLRGLATQAALGDRRGGLLAVAGVALGAHAEEGRLDCEALFQTTWEDEEGPLLDGEWEYVGGFRNVGDGGLSTVPHPFAGGAPGQ